MPYDPLKPVETFWDLGLSDMTSIWFAQVVGFEYRLIDYYENQGKDLPHYLLELQKRQYVYGTDWLPHDAKAKRLGSPKSVEELMKAAGRTVNVQDALSVADGINAARMVFANCWFDEGERRTASTAFATTDTKRTSISKRAQAQASAQLGLTWSRCVPRLRGGDQDSDEAPRQAQERNVGAGAWMG